MLDINMPITDGREACRQIVQTYKEGKKIRMYLPLLIAVSSCCGEDELLLTMKCGFDYAFEAPLKNQTIQERILPMLAIREK